jgi:hypothetical protein
MIETSGIILGHDVLAVRLAKFGKLADAVDDNTTFFALQYV